MAHRSNHLSDPDLLRFLDRETSSSEADAIREHLAQCPPCTARLSAAEATLRRVNGLYASQPATTAEPDPARHHLQQAFVAARRPPARSQHRLAYAALLLVAAGLGSYAWRNHAVSRHASSLAQSILPDRALTPGSIRAVSVSDLCPTGDDDLDPVVPDSIQRAVLKEYGIVPSGDEKNYQIDYLVNPQLGGTNDIRNLWPQPYHDAVWNAQAKDELEKRLHQMVCNHTVDLGVAQHEIEADWIAAYKKYVQPQHHA